MGTVQGEKRMSDLAKRTIVRAVLLTLSMAIPVPGVRAGEASAANAVTDRELAAWVEKRVKEWQISAAERPFDQIGWAKDIRDAERLARKHGRPIFLFFHSGQMATGRC